MLSRRMIPRYCFNREFIIPIIGMSGTGKTTLMKRLNGEWSSIGTDNYSKLIKDVSGVNIRLNIYNNSEHLPKKYPDAFVCIMDERFVSLTYAKLKLNRLMEFYGHDFPYIFIQNKKDIYSKPITLDNPISPISCKNGSRSELLLPFKYLVKNLKETNT
jgi:GTPase SAR1 family protein